MAEYKGMPMGAIKPNAPILKEKVELFIECRDIVKMDFQSNSDPFVVVFLKSSEQNQFTELGRTEVIHDNHYPKFTQQFRLDYYFEQEQILRFDVFDEDKKGSKKLKDHDLVGSCTMRLGEIVHQTGCMMAKQLMHKCKPVKNKKTKKLTHLIATVEKVNEHSNELVTLQFSCKGLPKMDGLFGKSDPYFLIERLREDNKKIRVYGNRKNYIKRDLNPVWKAFKIETQTLCNNDEYRPILISIYDWDSDGRDDYIGSVQTSLNELRTRPKRLKIKKLNSKRKKNRSYGELNVEQYSAMDLSSFLDYMQGTLDMSLMVAIDFTGSNGDPRDHKSLHYFTARQPSPYQNAIRQIGNILSEYDTDQKYPVWGFGAHFSNVVVGGKEYWNGVKHAFNLNLQVHDPEVAGIFGIEEAYVSSIKNQIFSLSGPTLFAPIIEKAKAIARIAHQNTMSDVINNKIQYFILLIITDGVITDMRQTKNEIVSISNEYLPVSLIIVGVGNADFKMMDELDGDKYNLINSKGQQSKRDIVQFVAINKYLNNLNGLSKETLMEIPKQFLSYVRYHNIKPGKRIVPQMEVITNKFNINEKVNEIDDDDEKEEIQINNNNNNENDSFWDNVPLPIGWESAYDENGQKYYVDNIHQTTQWTHPRAQAK